MLAMSSEANPSKRMIDLLDVKKKMKESFWGKKFWMTLIVHIIIYSFTLSLNSYGIDF